MNNSTMYEDLKQEILESSKEMLEYEIMLSAMENTVESVMLEPHLKEKLEFAMTISKEELPTLTDPNGNKTNLLGLSQEMIDEAVKLTKNEVGLARSVFFKELNKITQNQKKLGNLLENETSLSCKLEVSDLSNLKNLILDINTELENIVESQNELKEFKYTVIQEELIKQIEAIENNATVKLNDLRKMYEELLQKVYPSEECYNTINQAKSCFEEELNELNEQLEKLKSTEEGEVHESGDSNIREIMNQYTKIMREVNIKKMTIEELKTCL